jgi:hypothetical protein
LYLAFGTFIDELECDVVCDSVDECEQQRVGDCKR